jgi:hypothetical protein
MKASSESGLWASFSSKRGEWVVLPFRWGEVSIFLSFGGSVSNDSTQYHAVSPGCKTTAVRDRPPSAPTPFAHAIRTDLDFGAFFGYFHLAGC